MKKKVLTLIALSIIILRAQASECVQIQITAGTLSTVLTPDQLANSTSLILSGTIDARDFLTMRNKMPKLTSIDLYETVINAYSGKLGTLGPGNSYDYPANTIPSYALYSNSVVGKYYKYLRLPKTITAIGDYAFYNAAYAPLDSIEIPSTVVSIGKYAFYNMFISKIIIQSQHLFIDEYAFAYYIAYDGNIKIYINSFVPPVASPNSFYGVNMLNASLYIPISATSAYEQTDIWYNFYSTIESKDLISDVKSTITSDIKGTISNKQLTISGYEIGETLTIITVNGSVILKQKMNKSIETINLPSNGIFLIRIGKQAIKVSI